MSTDFEQLSSFRGLTERQRRLLDQRAAYRGGRYDFIEVERPGGGGVAYHKALPWEHDHDAAGNFVPSRYRRPLIELGLVSDMVDRLKDLTTGEGRMADMRFAEEGEEGPEGEALREVLLDEEGLDLDFQAPGQVVDLAVEGAACFGFSRPQNPDTGEERWEYLRLEVVWCEPVFAGQVYDPRARAIALELEEAVGLSLPRDREGPRLRVPAGARSDDLIFLRYQFPLAGQDVDDGEGNVERLWRRRDYLPETIVRYRDVKVSAGDDRAPVFEALQPAPHEWGVVPLVWIRGRGCEAGDTEGPALVDEALLSITRAADYSASFWTAASWMTAAPPLVEIDVQDDQRQITALAGDSDQDPFVIPGGAKAVHTYRSSGQNAGQVFLLEAAGGGSEGAKENTQALIQLAHETSRINRHDPEKASGAMSGVALELLNLPTISLVSGFRQILSRGWRLLVRKLWQAMEVEGQASGDSPPVILSWPRVFPLTAKDLQDLAGALVVAINAQVISQETAVQKMAEALEIGDPGAELEKVREEAEEALARAQAAFEQAEDQEDPEPQEGGAG